MLGFDFEIQYKPRCENKAVDALSRNPKFEEELKAVTVAKVVESEEVEHEVTEDAKLQGLIHDLLNDPKPHEGYHLRNSRLLYHGKLVLPKNSFFIPKFLSEFHSSPYGGHSGFFKTYKRTAAVLFWEGMKANIKKFVSEYDTCQRMKYESVSPVGLLQPLPIPTAVWEDISMDFVEGLPKARQVDTILVVIDRMTKYGHFLPLRHPFIVAEVAKKIIQEIVRLHGFSRSIVSDRDRIFLSQFWGEIFRAAGTKLKFSSSYHP